MISSPSRAATSVSDSARPVAQGGSPPRGRRASGRRGARARGHGARKPTRSHEEVEVAGPDPSTNRRGPAAPAHRPVALGSAGGEEPACRIAADLQSTTASPPSPRQVAQGAAGATSTPPPRPRRSPGRTTPELPRRRRRRRRRPASARRRAFADGITWPGEGRAGAGRRLPGLDGAVELVGPRPGHPSPTATSDPLDQPREAGPRSRTGPTWACPASDVGAHASGRPATCARRRGSGRGWTASPSTGLKGTGCAVGSALRGAACSR